MLNDFYKVIYNFYISKNEKDIPHIYTVCLISVLQILNIMSLLMFLEIFPTSQLAGKSLVIKLAIGVIIFNFIFYHRYTKRNPELFEVDKEKKRNFLIYLIVTLAIMLGTIIIKQIK